MSDWYQIESNQIILQAVSKGAEMKRLFNKVWNKEILWPGDQKIWNRSSPLLFPIVGQLKNDEYEFQGKKYGLPRHGFARDSEFICTKCSYDELEFYLGTSRETYKVYPFIFELKVKYKLIEAKLFVEYIVKNIDQKDMYFSIGAHPAFDTFSVENFELEFEKKEESFYLLREGLVDFNNKHPFRDNKLELNPKNFANDALIFDRPKSSYVNLYDKKSKHLIKTTFHNTKFLGVWGKDTLPFICIEPWDGVADSLNHDGNLEKKMGIIKLEPSKEHHFKYEIELMVKV